jgi:hypothetical protein
VSLFVSRADGTTAVLLAVAAGFLAVEAVGLPTDGGEEVVGAPATWRPPYAVPVGRRPD